MDKSVLHVLTGSLLALACTSPIAQADGLDDLHNTLTALKGDTPIYAFLESSLNQQRGKKEDKKTTTGYINLMLADATSGLQITYSSDILEKLEHEQMQLDQDEEADTPTINAMDNMETMRLNRMLSAAPSLGRFIKKAKFVEEQDTEYEGRPARRLVFDLPLESIVDSAEVRDYVDEFEGKYTVLTTPTGLPLQSILSFSGSGSAFLFFNVEMEQTRTQKYEMHNDRLVIVQEETQRSSSSTWADTDSTSVSQLMVQSSMPQLSSNRSFALGD